MALSSDRIKAALVNYLRANVALAALVDARINMFQVKTCAKVPYITLKRTQSQGVHHLKGASGLARATFEIKIHASSSSSLFDVSEAVRLALDGVQRTMWDDVEISSVTLTDEGDDDIAPNNKSQVGVYLTFTDVDIWYRRSVPSP